MNNIPEYTVKQLNTSIKSILEDNFEYIKLIGESGPVTIARSGHIYFSIKENDEVISCICWKGSYEQLSIKIEEGTEYNFFGRVTSYSKFGRSVYQLIVDQIEYSGDGSILKLIENRKKELSSKGYFDEKNKKKLPKYPEKIGVITSSSGSVIHDIIHRIRDRFPMTKILVYPVPVQGKNSHTEIIDYLTLIETEEDENKPDILIFARGGGSLEEMMPFNETTLIEKVFSFSIPSISAIGHETDYTLLDLVCDLRAPTPTAAAEMAVPDQIHISRSLQETKSNLLNILKKKLLEPKQNIMQFNSSINILSKRVYLTEKKLDDSISLNLKSLNSYFDNKISYIYHYQNIINNFNPRQKILSLRQKIHSTYKNNQLFVRNKIRLFSQRINLLERLLNSTSIDKNLNKGYAIIKKENKLIKNIKSLRKTSQFSITMKDGSLLIKK